MIVVDTSVWVAALRAGQGREAEVLQALLDADEAALALPVRLELRAGVSRAHRRALLHGLSALPVLVPSDETWRTAERWIDPAAEKGHRFAVVDLLIGALAHEIGALVWSHDDDFARMERLGFVQRYVPS